MQYSIIIPVYNGPQEIQDLLESLCKQSVQGFETIVVDDGSVNTAEHIVASFHDKLPVRYYYKEHSGPGLSRNFGFQRASGEYFIILDADCIVPDKYLEIVDKYLNSNYLDAFGGPDRAHKSFTIIQKSINYAITSLLTTGGIRGEEKHIGKFYPRSFNMGMSREVFLQTHGFSSMRYGEDIELSIRIMKLGFRTGLIYNAFVYHKRKENFSKFFMQVFHSGSARINIGRQYTGEIKLVHIFPAIFILYCLVTLLTYFLHVKISIFLTIFLMTYALAIFIDAGLQNKSCKIGFLSVIATFIQLFGYGLGFMSECLKGIVGRINQSVRR